MMTICIILHCHVHHRHAQVEIGRNFSTQTTSPWSHLYSIHNIWLCRSLQLLAESMTFWLFFSRLFLTFFYNLFFRPPPAKDQFQSPSVSYFCTVRLSNSSYSYLGIKYPFYFCGYFCHHDVFSLMLFHHTFPVMLAVLFTCLLCTDTRGGITHIALTSTKDLFVFWDTETLNWLWNRGSPKEHTTAKPITNMVRLRTQTLV